MRPPRSRHPPIFRDERLRDTFRLKAWCSSDAISVTLRSGLHRKKYWAILRGTSIPESIRVIGVSYSLRRMLARPGPDAKRRERNRKPRKQPSKQWNFERPIDKSAHEDDCSERRAWIQISQPETRCCPRLRRRGPRPKESAHSVAKCSAAQDGIIKPRSR